MKYDVLGDALGTFSLSLSNVGSLSMDTGADRCTLYYTAWNSLIGIGRLNVCTNVVEPPILGPPPTGQGPYVYDQLRALPDGRFLTTDDSTVDLLNASGQGVRAYFTGAQGTAVWGVSPGLDGMSFWSCCFTENFTSAEVAEFDISTGQVLSEFPVGPYGRSRIVVYPGTSPLPPSGGGTRFDGGTGGPGGNGAAAFSPGGGVPRAGGSSAPQVRKRLLSAILVPHGKAANMNALLSHGGYSFTWTAPSAGLFWTSWYQERRGAHLSTHAPIVIATVTKPFTHAKRVKITVALTAAGKRLLRRLHRVRLTASARFVPVGNSTATILRSFTLTR